MNKRTKAENLSNTATLNRISEHAPDKYCHLACNSVQRGSSRKTKLNQKAETAIFSRKC